MKVKRNFREAGLSAEEVAMLTYVEKLTLDPGSIAQDDVQALRDEGFTDPEILAICAATAYHNFNVRMADGLGVKLENRYDHIEENFRNTLLDKA